MRPWRLTRRQRVEMEAALLLIRPVTRRYASDVLHGASLLTPSDRWEWGVDGMREWRILRARVALALRAALRADEDARCEEAHFAAHTLATEEHEPLRKFARSRVWGALDAIDALREWPQAALSPKGTIPRALWEVAR